MGRARLKSLKESTFLTFLSVLKGWGLKKDKDWRYNAIEGTVYFTNGSSVYLKDLFLYPTDPEFDSLGSTEYTGAFIDEVSEITEKAKNIVMSRLRFKLDEYSLIPKLLMASNPAKNWAYKDYWRPWKEGKLKPYRYFIVSLVGDNPFISKYYKENLLKLDKNSKERLLYGNWEYDDDPSKLFEYDKILDIFTNNYFIPTHSDNYISCDVARFGSDKTVAIVWRAWHIEKIVVLPKSSIKEVRDLLVELARIHRVPHSNIIIDEDGVGCLTKNTEVLLSRGWTKIQNVKKGDKIYSKNKNDQLILQDVKDNILREKTRILDNGEYSYSFSHFLPFKTRPEYSYKLSSWDDIIKKDIYLDNSVETTNEIKYFKFKNTIYKMPHGGFKKLNNGLKILDKDFCGFLGWFLSEGNLAEKNGIIITQSTKSKYNKRINKMLKNCGFNYDVRRSKNGSYKYRIQHKALHKYLVDNCYNSIIHHAPYKKLPEEIKLLRKEALWKLISSYRDGDGYTHKTNIMIGSTSKQMLDDLAFCAFLCGRVSDIKLKQKKGSNGWINGRKITRQHDFYDLCIFVKHGLRSKKTTIKEYMDNVYELKITGDTRLFLNRFSNEKIFWTHNGGVVDFMDNVKGFINNSTPIETEFTKKIHNYKNLKTQCYFKLAEIVSKGEIGCYDLPMNIKEGIIEDLEQIAQKNIDRDGKIEILGKDEIKERLGRSTDFGDALMMRCFFDLKSYYKPYIT